MFRYIRFAFPIVICLMALIGFIANWFMGNGAATDAYFLALLGWVVISTDELVSFLKEKKEKV